MEDPRQRRGLFFAFFFVIRISRAEFAGQYWAEPLGSLLALKSWVHRDVCASTEPSGSAAGPRATLRARW